MKHWIAAISVICGLIVITGGAVAYGSGSMIGSHGAASGQYQEAKHAGGLVSASVPTDASGTLPFTGQDLAVVAGLGAVLVGVGIALERGVKRPGQSD